MHEKIDISTDFIKCLEKYRADVVVILECEFDYPQVLLIHLCDKRIIHFFNMDRAVLREKINRYRDRKYVIVMRSDK